jgi:endonuclease/exonuclease/phosphatase family metal-dependent hydrolase
MIRIMTWNIGSFSFLKYIKYFGIKYKDQKIIHEYFQPKINSDFISKSIKKINPDILFLQEFYFSEDTRYIEILKDYPYQRLINTWYHKHSILIASKHEFTVLEKDKFLIISYAKLNFIPIHLNSYYASKRLEDLITLNEITKNLQNIIILGDTNIWSRGNFFFFRNDRMGYKILTKHLLDFSKKLISTSYFGLGFDKVFGSPNLKISKIESPKIRNYFMDHYPVVFEIEL